jgi:uncharacterized protein
VWVLFKIQQQQPKKMLVIDQGRRFISILLTTFVLNMLLFKTKGLFAEYDILFQLILKIIIGISICIINFLLYKKYGGFNINKKEKNVLNWEIISFIILIVMYVYLSLNNIQINTLKNIALTLISIFFGALAEEYVCRLYFLNLFRSNNFSTQKSILFSSILFAIVHTSNIILDFTQWVNVLNEIIFAFFIGVILSCIYLNTRKILLVGIFHFVINIPTLVQSNIVNNGLLHNAETKTLLKQFFGSSMLYILWLPVYLFAIYILQKTVKHFK